MRTTQYLRLGARSAQLSSLRRERRETLYRMQLRKHGCVRCFVCREPVSEADATLEHILPLSKGGSDEMDNLAISHRDCNIRRGNSTERKVKVLVTGGRKFGESQFERDLFYSRMDKLHASMGPIGKIVHGNASGADSLAKEWARERGIQQQAYPADWKRHRNAAGPIRNKLMADVEKPDLVVAFPGGKGTAGMVAIARAAGIRVIHARIPPA